MLKLVSRGLSNAQVAKELFISPHAVNRHLNSIYAKLGVNSRAAATRFASGARSRLASRSAPVAARFARSK